MPLLITAPAKKQKENACKYFWKDDERAGYVLVIDESNGARLWEEAGQWHMRAALKGQTYTGARDTLEDAFKATDRLVYKNFPHVWTSTNCRVILEKWEGVLS